MKEGYIYILKVSLMQPTPSEIEPFRERGVMFPIIALFQGIYANWTKLSIFDHYKNYNG